MRRFCSILILLFASALVGCTSSPGPTNAPALYGSAGSSHAECLVCKKNADLACIDVTVEKDTPSYTFNGTTYYFCSTECRDKFAKDPAKYLSPK